MSQRLEEWLERLRGAKDPGPVARITATRNNRDAGWLFEVTAETNLAELAERIDNACRDAGFGAIYELRAVDAEGRFIAPFAHKAQVAEIMPAGSGQMPLVHPGVEASIGAALQNNRSFAALGLDSIKKAQQATDRLMDRLEAEVAELRRENARLRTKIADHWETMHRLNTHELETKQEKDKVERMGRMGETFVNAFMARAFGQSATLEGQTVEYQMAMALFRSLAGDMERRAQELLPHLTEDEQVAVMELMRPKDDPPAKKEEKPNELVAAAAAAATNSGKAA